MSSHIGGPTPCPDVNVVLRTLLDDAQSVLGHHFVGLYLYGSLAGGDFNPQTSDIDFVVVTNANLPDELIHNLEAPHMRLWYSGLKWAAKLEGAYVPVRTLRRYDPAAAPCPRSMRVASISIVRAANGSFSITSGANTAR